MAATNAARSWDEDQDLPAPPTQSRSWATRVDYDILEDAADHAAPPATPTRARHTPTSTQRLHAVPGGRREQVTYHPPASPAVERPTRVYERSYNPSVIAAPHAGSATLRMALYGLGAAAVAVALYLVVSTLITWTQLRLDDMTYGNPRTTHLEAAVGLGDSELQPTHFIGLNLHRQVSIIVLPAGDISKALVISGPYLFGAGEDLTPVKLRTVDLNNDGKLDLLVNVKNEELAYINDKNSFRPITPEEKAKVEQAPGE